MVTFPFSITFKVLITVSLPNNINRSCNCPALSSGSIAISEFKIIAPVSILSSMKKVVTPVLVSPLIMAQLIGAAPR
ncbi:hypothetical protein D3C87_1509860 [compost metagenome]